jgi:hypothetical protein
VLIIPEVYVNRRGKFAHPGLAVVARTGFSVKMKEVEEKTKMRRIDKWRVFQ